MSTVQEIEAAIRALSQKEKKQLVADLPNILPELNSDLELKEVVAAAGSTTQEQTPDEEKLVRQVITDYRAAQRHKR